MPLNNEFERHRLLLQLTTIANEATSAEALLSAGEAITHAMGWREGAVWIPDRDGGAPPTAEFTLPLTANDETLAVLAFDFDGGSAPDEAAVEILTRGAAQLGHALARIRAEAALRFSEATVAGMVSISSDAVISVDQSQIITFFNQGAEHIFRYRAEEVLGQPLELLIPERYRGAHHGHVEEFGTSPVVARRMGERGQITGRRKGGEIFPADASISKQEVLGNRIYTAVVRDTTERHRVEEALARQAAELTRSNADLEQFAYVASHDLQEPLRMVASYTQLLARRYRGTLDADADEFIGYVVEGVSRMQGLIHDLLAYSRVGTRELERREVELDRLVDQVLTDLGPAIEEAGAVVTRDALPRLRADERQIAQLFQNLIANALKFRGQKPARVHISAEQTEAGWHFAVADNGIGIAPEFRDRIFVIFQRLHTREEYPGTGIGLSICKKIVERRGGRIWVENEAGEGTAFHFILPIDAEVR